MGTALIDAPLAWDTANGAGTVVAVVDTGIDSLHPDLAANVWTNPGEIAGNGIDDDGNGFVDDVHGWDFVAERRRPDDHHGHGTHVAGIARPRRQQRDRRRRDRLRRARHGVKGLGDSGSG